MRIAIGSDHAGTELKSAIADEVKKMGHQIRDCGPEESVKGSVDYPDYAGAVAGAVSKKDADLGILICGTGIGMSIAANKIAGVRAAVVWDEFTARMAKHHNNVNVLCLGSRTTPVNRAIDLMKIWLETQFEGGRHQARLDKIQKLERS